MELRHFDRGCGRRGALARRSARHLVGEHGHRPFCMKPVLPVVADDEVLGGRRVPAAARMICTNRFAGPGCKGRTARSASTCSRAALRGPGGGDWRASWLTVIARFRSPVEEGVEPRPRSEFLFQMITRLFFCTRRISVVKELRALHWTSSPSCTARSCRPRAATPRTPCAGCGTRCNSGGRACPTTPGGTGPAGCRVWRRRWTAWWCGRWHPPTEIGFPFSSSTRRG